MRHRPDDSGTPRRSALQRRLRELAFFLDPILVIFGGLVGAYCYWVSTLVDANGDMPARDAFLAAVAVAAFVIFATDTVARRSAEADAAERYSARIRIAQEQGLDAWEVVSALEDAIALQRKEHATGPAAGAVSHVLDVLGNEILLAERVLSTTYRTSTLLGDDDPHAPGTSGAAERSLLLRKEVRGLRDEVRRKRLDAFFSREASRRAPIERTPVERTPPAPAEPPGGDDGWPTPAPAAPRLDDVSAERPARAEPTEPRPRAARTDAGDKRPQAARPRTRRT